MKVSFRCCVRPPAAVAWAVAWGVLSGCSQGEVPVGESQDSDVDMEESVDSDVDAADSEVPVDSDAETSDSDVSNDSDPVGGDTDLGGATDSELGDTDVVGDSLDTDTDESLGDTDSVGWGDTGGVEPSPCETPVAIAPTELWALPKASYRFRRVGGTGVGPFVWSMTASSGGIFSPSTGFYVAGPTERTVDRIRVEDRACGSLAEAVVHIVQPMTVGVSAIRVATGSTVHIPVTGGSGDWRCTLATDATGARAEVSADGSECTYESGSAAGTDRITVEDLGSGQTLSVVSIVAPSTQLRLNGTALYAPIGVPVEMVATTGSGTTHLSVVSGDARAVSATQVVATGTTPATIRVDDAMVDDFSTFVTLTATTRVMPPLEPMGMRLDNLEIRYGQTVPLGDVDGDGDDEFAAGMPRISGLAPWSGVVGIWSGTDADPEYWLGWNDRDDMYGESVVTGDYDGDGTAELVVGAPEWGGSVGRAFVYPLTPEGLADVQSGTPIVAPSSSRFGRALATCDFDDDGYDDLAVGAPAYDVTGRTDVGAVFVYRGTPEGLAPTPTVRTGAFSRTTGPIATANLGFELATGDFDGDGICDLAAGGPGATVPLSGDTTANDGLVVVFRGMGGVMEEPIESAPWRMWMASAASDQPAWGRRLAAGDLDGDLIDDLVFGGPLQDNPSAPDGGSVRVYLSSENPDDIAFSDGVLSLESSSDLAIAGTVNSEMAGCSLAIADLTADGTAELAFGACGAQNPVGQTTGVVRVYAADQLLERVYAARTLPADGTSIIPRFRHYGPPPVSVWYAHFGRSLGIIPDAAGDGLPDLVVLAPNDSRYGYGLGSLWRIDGVIDSFTVGGRRAELGVPAPVWTDHRMGNQGTFDFVDFVGSGSPALVLGDAAAREPSVSVAPGLAWAVVSPSASPVFSVYKGHLGHSDFDRFGSSVTALGDFDGDGHPDLGVGASGADIKATTFSSASWQTPLCATLPVTGDAGALYVYTSASTTPSFVAFGLEPIRFSGTFGGPDVNGDGRADTWLAASSGGRVDLLFGKAVTDPSHIELVCPSTTIRAAFSSGFGQSFANLGDIDGDHCDETAIGASFDDLGSGDRGTVRVIWGFGSRCSTTKPLVTTVFTLVTGTRLGAALAGADVNGDGKRELWIGAPGHKTADGVNRGGLFVLSGATLAAAPRDPLTAGSTPTDTTRFVTLTEPIRAGTESSTTWPASIAVVPAPSGGYAVWLGGANLRSNDGVLEGYRYSTLTGLSERPIELVYGWPGDGGNLGAHVAFSPTTLAVGAPFAESASPIGVDVGAVYLAPWP